MLNFLANAGVLLHVQALRWNAHTESEGQYICGCFPRNTALRVEAAGDFASIHLSGEV